MLHVIEYQRDGEPQENLDIFSDAELVEFFERIKNKNIDNVIIRNLPVPDNLPDTPTTINNSDLNTLSGDSLLLVGGYLGDISEKGIENSIRFSTSLTMDTNTETWHGHPQFNYSVFFCLRGDSNAKTYFLSANQIIREASEQDQKILLESRLIRKVDLKYEFSPDFYVPSDFQAQVKDLDLPDTSKGLDFNREDPAYKYLLTRMLEADEYISYQPGDLVVYNERQTIRFSPSYIPTSKSNESRWLLSVGIHY